MKHEYPRSTLDRAHKEIRCLLRSLPFDQWPVLCPRSEHLARLVDSQAAQELYALIVEEVERDTGGPLTLVEGRIVGPPAGVFFCPECGSHEVRSMEATALMAPDPADPWSLVWERITCGNCGMLIPAHLGERWNHRTPVEAAEEWNSIYRELAAPGVPDLQ
jgi:hypothetical protein